MAVYIGMIDGKFYHTYSKHLKDEYFGKDYHDSSRKPLDLSTGMNRGGLFR